MNIAFRIICVYATLLLVGCINSTDTSTPDAPLTETVVMKEPSLIAETSTTRLTVTPIPLSTPQITVTPIPSITITNTPLPSVTPTNNNQLELINTPELELTSPPKRIQNNNSSMIYIDEGEFLMGTLATDLLSECRLFRPSCQQSWFTPSEPPHLATLDDFYIDIFEVSNANYLQFLQELEDHQSTCLGEDCLELVNSQIQLNDDGLYEVSLARRDHPVVGVTWFGAAAFCDWRGGRLPTEAEWEKAASWNSKNNEQTRYPWGNTFDGTIVNFCDATCTKRQANRAYSDRHAETAPIGSFAAGQSHFGVYNMAGNVWEWVADWFDEDYYEDVPAYNPQGPEDGRMRTVRGGSWFDTGNFVNTQFRSGIEPDQSGDTIGFRCVLDVPKNP